MNVSRSLSTGIGLIVLLLLGWTAMAGGEDRGQTRDPGDAFQQSNLKDDTSANAEVVAELEMTTVHGMRIPSTRWPSFIRRMERMRQGMLRQAHLQLAGRSFRVVLGSHPQSQFYLYDEDRNHDPSWRGASSLKSYHPVDDTLYQFRLVDNGAKVAARPYRGEFGILKLMPGRRPLKNVGFEGAVLQEGGGLAPIKNFGDDTFQLVAECRLPVGDYRPHSLTVIYDNLRFRTVGSYLPSTRGGAPWKEPDYALTVNGERPCVLDFSGEPRVVFQRPRPDRRVFSPGKRVLFMAILVDPALDIMIQDLCTISPPKHKPNFPRVLWDRKRLAPKVVIARANGEVVAEGLMPFG